MGQFQDDGREGGLRYVHKGVRYPSVTTVLGMEPQPWMKAWATRETALWAVESLPTWRDLDPDDAVALIKRGPEKHREGTSQIGTAVHLYAEAHGKGEPLPAVPKALVPYCNSFLAFLEDFKPVPLLTEEKVFHTKLRYAGTFDSLCLLPGLNRDEPVLIDYKTGKGTYGTVAMQLRALAEAEFMQGPKGEELDFPRPTAFAVVHLRPTKYALKVVHAERPEVWRTFRALRAVYDWMKIADQVIEDYDGGNL